MDLPIRIAILGAGRRGALFGDILSEFPRLATITAVAEPREAYRNAFAAHHGLTRDTVFTSWQDFMAESGQCDAAVIGTMDLDHVEPTMACLARGHHVLLEKPMAPTLEACEAIVLAAERSTSILAVCHSLRYQKGFRMVKDLVDAGRIGQIVTIDQLEQVGFEHFAHSYVRGNWGNTARATPLLLAKSCHDVDYITYLIGRECRSVGSYGSLMHFRGERAPEGSRDRCTDGCTVERECAYSALKQYTEGDLTSWPASIVSHEHTIESHRSALESGPYGRCVFRTDNDVVDHQVVMMEFEGGATATLTVTAFTHGGGRRIRVHGSEGELSFDESTITLRTFASKEVEIFTPGLEEGPHGGGDRRLIQAWLKAIATSDPSRVSTGAMASMRSHAICFAAERSRLEHRIVDMKDMEFRR